MNGNFEWAYSVNFGSPTFTGRFWTAVNIGERTFTKRAGKNLCCRRGFERKNGWLRVISSEYMNVYEGYRTTTSVFALQNAQNGQGAVNV